SIGLVRALAAEKLAGDRLQSAQRAEAEATKERNAAREAEAKATREAAIAQAISAFLQTDLLEMASVGAHISSDFSPDPDVKLRTLLDRAEKRVSERFRDQPAVEAAIRKTLASAYAGVGEPARAAQLYDKVREYQEATLGADHPDTLMTRLAIVANLQKSRRAE